MSALAIPRLTPQQYLTIERQADHRSEFLDAVMYAMAGGSMTHVFLTAALVSELRRALRGTGCQVGASDLRVSVSNIAYFYPDVVVTCGELIAADGSKDTLVNPTMIVEVLSRSTERFDRGEKFRHYQRIESLREYVLVSQTEPRIEVFARQSDVEWTRTEFAGPEAVCRFESLDCRIPVASIHEDITLGDES